ncbi:(Fe-S)-binding protein [Romboutsia ilealis]|uniref:(Fe-S)-binding protein n=1 Tax=Romboutsia ilealis TaxID=1115758 RepID=UPI0025B76806|nr:(Fe-S)-binding protein [Romboutsia ilealis]
MFLESIKMFYENNEVDPIEIYKYLPKLDCKKCRYQSCLSFAIMLAKCEANINRCVHLKGNEYNLKKVKSYVKML